jgi:hypothetical protein
MMHASIWDFSGEPKDLLDRYEAMISEIPPESMRLHLCLQAADGIVIVDTCPDHDSFTAFATGPFRELRRRHGLPDPTTLSDYPVHRAVVDGAERSNRIAAQPTEGSTMSQENVDLVTGGYDDFNRGDIEAITARLGSDVEWIEPGGGDAPQGTFHGPDAVAKNVFGSVPQNFDEFTCTVENARDQGDTVVVTAHFRGKNKSGAELDAHAEHVWNVRDGKLVRMENTVDQEAWAKGWS